jgi:hypothetical protein
VRPWTGPAPSVSSAGRIAPLLRGPANIAHGTRPSSTTGQLALAETRVRVNVSFGSRGEAQALNLSCSQNRELTTTCDRIYCGTTLASQ